MKKSETEWKRSLSTSRKKTRRGSEKDARNDAFCLSSTFDFQSIKHLGDE